MKTENGRIMLLSKFSVYDRKKSKFFKEQEASGLLDSLGIKTPLNKVILVVPFCFKTINEWNSQQISLCRR